ncbi:hypothetical protein B9G98_01095 [Wickerhamiella sorbophila]|uniref:Uncharacterized protein n=1 Tax=Wickerhamiella sorbophila TaxID=45607 RepID=A0A2T0FER8_9ASCO|nr:hypothetical protein B9G98_01095 [Wickerhamiella sorbophila]PRT53475.1 hypothetical protein B9G98_01095 [Wickerhamiella sorbophila]
MPKSRVDKSRILAQFRGAKARRSPETKPRFKQKIDEQLSEAPGTGRQGPIGELISTRSAMLKISGPPPDAIAVAAPQNRARWNSHVDVCGSDFYIALDAGAARDYCYCYGPGIFIYCKQFLS